MDNISVFINYFSKKDRKHVVGFIFLACSFSTCSIVGFVYVLGDKELTCAAQGMSYLNCLAAFCVVEIKCKLWNVPLSTLKGVRSVIALQDWSSNSSLAARGVSVI